jgi:ABC-2 type transport system ATP-binding protein
VRENLEFYASIYGVLARERAGRVEEVIARSGLGERRKQIAGTLSGGWKQRLALACATIHDPPLLFLDEPTAGVDPVSRREFWQRIHALAADGTTIVVTTHYMDEAERCHRLAFIFRGTVLDVGTPEEVVARRRLAVVELDVDDAPAAVRVLARAPDVEECASYGHVLRAVVRGEADAAAHVERALHDHGLAPRRVRATRPTVEDAFISMVREDERREEVRA